MKDEAYEVRQGVIRKVLACLRLSNSSNENEAKAAILAARKLMAKHKIEESELDDGRRKYEVTEIATFIDYVPTGKSAWIGYVATTICKNFACGPIIRSPYRSRRASLYIRGYEHDAKAALAALRLAKATVERAVKGKNMDETLSYGYGFNRGLIDAFAAQDAAQDVVSTALVMTWPKEVRDYMNTLTQDKRKAKWYAKTSDYDDGYEAGRNHLNPKVEGVKE